MSLFVKTTENILKAGGVHAHHKLKYSLTRGLNHSNSLHCSATASCLWKEHKHTWLRPKYSNYHFMPTTNNLQGNQHPGAPQKCGDLKQNSNLTSHRTSNSVTKKDHTILASNKAPVSSRENLGRASLIRYSRIVSTSPIVQWFRRTYKWQEYNNHLSTGTKSIYGGDNQQADHVTDHSQLLFSASMLGDCPPPLLPLHDYTWQKKLRKLSFHNK
jgi:hypothetical protein